MKGDADGHARITAQDQPGPHGSLEETLDKETTKAGTSQWDWVHNERHDTVPTTQFKLTPRVFVMVFLSTCARVLRTVVVVGVARACKHGGIVLLVPWMTIPCHVHIVNLGTLSGKSR